MFNINKCIIILISAFLLQLGFSPDIQADRLRVAAASNFYPTLNLIKQEYENEQHRQFDLVKGSTGKLFAQIKHGAPYDVFLSADVERPRRLEQQGLIVRGSRITYAKGQLALIASKYKSLDQNRTLNQIINTDTVMRIAIANPKIAPYGKAAVEVLRYNKLYEETKTKLVYGENVAQAFQFVQSGSAEFGFVALSLAKALAKAHSIKYWQPLQESYQPLEQQLVILKTTKKIESARDFVEFLMSHKIQQFIQQQGYQAP